jgi:hypothetical protein
MSLLLQRPQVKKSVTESVLGVECDETILYRQFMNPTRQRLGKLCRILTSNPPAFSGLRYDSLKDL